MPLALIEPQLASGRISIAPDVFEAALPEKHRGLFQADEVKTPVALPLEEVLKNLPATILKLRDDQEDVALDTDFETPFSAKAKEDARRFATDKSSTEKISDQATEQPKIDPPSLGYGAAGTKRHEILQRSNPPVFYVFQMQQRTELLQKAAKKTKDFTWVQA